MFDTPLSTVVDGGSLGIPKARCQVYLMERRTISLRRYQFTSATSPAR